MILGYVFLMSFFTKKELSKKYNLLTPTIKQKQSIQTLNNQNKPQINKYTVKSGDYLWKIAEQTYGSGYNAYDIAKANNISEPNLIYENDILVLPSVKSKEPTTGEITSSIQTEKVVMTQVRYTIQEGDCLWTIAQDAYGDGFAWNRIAKANNLADPSIINPGQILTIPRN